MFPVLLTKPADLIESFNLAQFVQGYAECMIWANTENVTDPDDSIDPSWWQSPSPSWALEAFSDNDSQYPGNPDYPSSKTQIERAATQFVESNIVRLTQIVAANLASPAYLGHNLALTANQHGAGFWDTSFDTDGTLTDSAHNSGQIDCYWDSNDDSGIHCN